MVHGLLFREKQVEDVSLVQGFLQPIDIEWIQQKSVKDLKKHKWNSLEFIEVLISQLIVYVSNAEKLES
jgi:hypothetical protein